MLFGIHEKGVDRDGFSDPGILSVDAVDPNEMTA